MKFMSSQEKGCKFDQFESKHKFSDGFPEGQFHMLCVPKAAADAARHGHEASAAAAADATVPDKIVAKVKDVTESVAAKVNDVADKVADVAGKVVRKVAGKVGKLLKKRN